MNERIRELGRQATIWCVDQPNQEDFDAMWEEKFAELLVKECVSRIKRVGILEDIENETDMVADAIKEHFGAK